MSHKRAKTAYTATDLLKNIPGWKAPEGPPVDGETAVEFEHLGGDEERQSVIPQFSMTQKFEYVSKNSNDSVR